MATELSTSIGWPETGFWEGNRDSGRLGRHSENAKSGKQSFYVSYRPPPIAGRKLVAYDGGKWVPTTMSAISDAINGPKEILKEIDRRSSGQ
jgi:hypothetical protein